jgi:RNA polymerase sigma-70 factor (ECF subfamily)
MPSNTKVEFAMVENDRNAAAGASRNEQFVSLLSRFQSQLFNYIFCIVQTLPDTEDVFQQTTLAMWDHFDQFQPGSDFLAWASKIARFRALNFIRAKRRERVFFSEALIGELAENGFEPADAQNARLKALASCREKLSGTDQKLVSLCYGTCNTIGEAAELLRRPLQAVYHSLWRIRRALHKCIERTLAGEEQA